MINAFRPGFFRKIFSVKIFLCYILMLFSSGVFAQENVSRQRILLNDNWKFKLGGWEFASTPKFNDDKWETIHLPHTWNAKDPFDDDRTYYRGIGWYRKTLKLDASFKSKNISLYFNGANEVTDVYVNGWFAGQHKGGYTAFSVDITKYVKFDGHDVLAVQVNNAHDNYIPPLSVGYAMYGGIYRDVWLVATEPIHFSNDDYASSGVYISTPEVSEKSAKISIRSILKNESAKAVPAEVVHTIYNAENKSVGTIKQAINLEAGKSVSVKSADFTLQNPQLWSPDKPNLYHIISRLVVDGKKSDEISNPLGLRWFSINPKTGFSLNGKKLPLKGTNRHQDMEGKGSALTMEDHLRDMRIIKNMGCNFLRLAHYPQDPEILRLADELGLLIWEEIPVVDNITPEQPFLDNCKHMLREMIKQNYNHPSVVIWGFMNEPLLWSQGNLRIQKHEASPYIDTLVSYAKQLDATVRAEDPARLSTMAMHGSDDYDKFGLSKIAQLTSYNMYDGWYSGEFSGFGKTLDEKHRQHPEETLFISEYGAESDKQVNAEKPERFDFTGQYQRLYHEAYIRQIKQRPWLAGTAIWNQFDFSQPNVGGTISHLNHKGLVSWGREPKDAYYLYKANWNPAPMVYIASRDWQHRGGKPNAISTIDIYSNLPEVGLSVNGKNYPAQKPDDVGKAVFKVGLKEGVNQLLASGKSNDKTVSDPFTISYSLFPDKISEQQLQTGLRINLGSNTQYLDDANEIWMDDRPYKNGSYGYVGGEPARLGIKSLITNTEYKPLFYTYLNGPKSYQFDVPDGRYEVELAFTEPDDIEKGKRVFDVSINGETVIGNLDLAAENGFAVAVKKAFETKANKGKGIQIEFRAKAGKPVLSGIKITRK